MLVRLALCATSALMIPACGSTPESSHRPEAPEVPAASPVELLPGPAFLAAYAKTEGAYLVDCRTPSEQSGGMLDGAVAMDYRAEGFRESVNQLERDRPVFVYCASGGRSGRAAELMTELGFERIVDLEGGYRGLGQ